MANARPEHWAVEQTTTALGDDARARGKHAAAETDPQYVQYLGPVPDDPLERDRRIEAAGRVAQHHALWGTPNGATFVGHMPTFENDDDYRITFYAANRAIRDLDRSAGIDRQARGRDESGLSI